MAAARPQPRCSGCLITTSGAMLATKPIKIKVTAGLSYLQAIIQVVLNFASSLQCPESSYCSLAI